MDKVVAVAFPNNNKFYCYKTTISDLEVGDFVIVDCNNERKLVIISAIENIPEEHMAKATKFIWRRAIDKDKFDNDGVLIENI